MSPIDVMYAVSCMRFLRRIAQIKWQDKMPNTEVLQRCGMFGIEAFVIKAQLHWVGHVCRMSDSRIPTATFYVELPSGIRPNCRPLLRSKERFYKSVHPCSRVLRYKTLHMR